MFFVCINLDVKAGIFELVVIVEYSFAKMKKGVYSGGWCSYMKRCNSSSY